MNIQVIKEWLLQLLVNDPFPDPNIKRPTSMTGNMALVPFNIAPPANVQDPIKHRPENRNSPTEKKGKTEKVN